MTRRWIFIRALFSVILATVICLLFIDRGYKYTALVVKTTPFNMAVKQYYFDLDNDGQSERVVLFNKIKGITSIIVYEWDNDIIDQFNVNGNIVNRSGVYTGDYNSDQKSELYFFTYFGDSLFLNVIDPYAGENHAIARKLIEGCRTINGEASYMIDGSAMEDINNDRFLEFYFSITAGFTLSPRNMYCFDLINDSISVSPVSGSGPRIRLRNDDIDGDGYIELWGVSNAFNNYGDSVIPYSDHSAWLQVFSHTLEFEFEPVEFEGFGSIVDAQVIHSGDQKKLVVFRTYRGNSDAIDSEVLLVTAEGRIEKRLSLADFDLRDVPNFYLHDSRIIIYDKTGRMIILNESLEHESIFEKEWLRGSFFGPHQLKDEGAALLFFSVDGTLRITDTDFKILAQLPMNVNSDLVLDVQTLSTKDVPEGFLVKTTQLEYLISLNLNPRRYIIFVYGLIICLTIYLFVYIIQAMQIRQEKRKLEAENKLRTLQLQSIKSQMNPHFIFNALNSIAAMYMKGNSVKAEKFLISFSRMIREVVDSSDRVIVTLKEEIVFVRHYLELEKVRYGDNFIFHIAIPKDCQDIKLPSMCIHTFVENSVKHAFPVKSKEMVIEIEALKADGKLTIRIRDNGIGFSYNENQSGRTGRGIQLVSEILNSFSKISNKEAHFTITNLSNGEEPIAGSEITCIIDL